MNVTFGTEPRSLCSAFVPPRWGLVLLMIRRPRAALVPRLPWAGLARCGGHAYHHIRLELTCAVGCDGEIRVFFGEGVTQQDWVIICQ
jgi:hypothetical protein